MKKVIETKKEVVKERLYQFTCDVCGKPSDPSTDEDRFCEIDVSATCYTPILKWSTYYGWESEDWGDEIALCHECFEMVPKALERLRAERIAKEQE